MGLAAGYPSDGENPCDVDNAAVWEEAGIVETRSVNVRAEIAPLIEIFDQLLNDNQAE